MPEKGRQRLEMHVAGLGVHPDSGATVLLLEGEGAELAMIIGLGEAHSIAKALGQLEIERPLAHDLFHATLEALGAKLLRVEVIDLRGQTYFAELFLERPDGETVRIDSRPSDAIALALRAGAGIFVHEHVVRKEPRGPKEIPSPTDKEGWKKLLEEMEPEDFGKYKM